MTELSGPAKHYLAVLNDEVLEKVKEKPFSYPFGNTLKGIRAALERADFRYALYMLKEAQAWLHQMLLQYAGHGGTAPEDEALGALQIGRGALELLEEKVLEEGKVKK